MHRIVAAVVMTLFVGCGASQTGPDEARRGGREPERSVDPVAPEGVSPPLDPCARPLTSVHEFEVPRFALSRRTFATRIGDRIFLMTVNTGSSRMQAGSASANEFQGAAYDVEQRTWSAIPAPPDRAVIAGTDGSHDFRLVDERIVMLAHAHLQSSVSIFDASTGRWAAVERTNTPPNEMYLTGPYRQASLGDRLYWWPAHSDGTDYADGYVLDAAAARWSRAPREAAPSARITALPVVLSHDRVLLLPNNSTDLALFDAEAGRWSESSTPGAAGDFHAVAHSEHGDSLIVLRFGPLLDGRRSISAFIVDLETLTSRSLPAPTQTTSMYPNTSTLHVDARRVVYVTREELLVFDRAAGAWSSQPLPFEMSPSGSAFMVPVCGEKLLLFQHDAFLLHLEDLSWHALAWPDGVPRRGVNTLFERDHIAVLGNARTERDPSNCPPGAPCAAPREHRVEDPRAFLVPIVSAALVNGTTNQADTEYETQVTAEVAPQVDVGVEPPVQAPAAEAPWPTLPHAPSAQSVPTGADLSGTWLETTTARPRGPVQRTAHCSGFSGHWSFEQRGDAVQAELRGTTNYSSGVRGRFMNPGHTFVAGTRQGPNITLEGYYHPSFMTYGPPGAHSLVQTVVPENEPVTMTLRFDRRSGHLVGTKNGQPVRLAPLRVVQRTAPCPPPGPPRA